MLGLLFAFAALVSAVSYSVEANAACTGSGVESYRIYAMLNAGETLRAVDVNLLAASGTSLQIAASQIGGSAPVPPLLPSETCNTYVSWGRISSGTDLTWVTPDFALNSTRMTKGWFLSDPNAPQGAATNKLQIGQITISAPTGQCVAGPSISGTLNLLLSGPVQNVFTVCIGSGCQGATGCNTTVGYIVPSINLPASSSANVTLAYHLVRAGFAPIALDPQAFDLGRIARRASVGLGAVVNGRQPVLALNWLTDGSESRYFGNTTSTRRVLVTIVKNVNSQVSACTQAIAFDTLRDRFYSAAKYLAELTEGRLTLNITVQTAIVNTTGLPAPLNSFNFCGNFDQRIQDTLGFDTSSYNHRIHLSNFNPLTTYCGETSSTLGAPPSLGGWSYWSTVGGSCQNVAAVVNGLLHQFGLSESDAQSGLSPSAPRISLGDGSCLLGRVPISSAAEGVQRRSINVVQRINFGLLTSQNIFVASKTSAAVVRLYSPFVKNQINAVDVSAGYYLSYRATSDPGLDRQANFTQTSVVNPLLLNPLGLPSFTGVVLIHRRMADGTTRLAGSMAVGASGVINDFNVTVFFVDRFSAQIGLSNTSAFVSKPAAPVSPVLDSDRLYIDARAADTVQQTRAGGRDVNQAFNDNVLQVGRFDATDNDPYTFVRFQLNVPRYSLITDANLIFEVARVNTSENQNLFLELAIEDVDASPALAVGSNLFLRSWSAVRVSRVANSSSSSSSMTYLHDEFSIDVSVLVQYIVHRSLWQQGSSITFRIRNDQARKTDSGARYFYAGDNCGVEARGGDYPCGPRLNVGYQARTYSVGTFFPTLYQPTLTNEPLSNVYMIDSLYHTLTESGSPTPHLTTQFYTFDQVSAVRNGTLYVNARTTGPETFQVQVLLGSTWSTVMTFNSAQNGAYTTLQAALPASATTSALQVRIQDAQSSSAAASTISVNLVSADLSFANVDCVVADFGAFSRCPPCDNNPQRCHTRLVVVPSLGTGAACPALTECVPCVPTAFPPGFSKVTVVAFVSIDSQQQWKSVQTTDTGSLEFHDVPGLPNAKIGVAGKALTIPGSSLPSGFYQAVNMTQVPGFGICNVTDVVLSCPSGDPTVQVGLYAGLMACLNGKIPGPTTPAVSVFTIECR